MRCSLALALTAIAALVAASSDLAPRDIDSNELSLRRLHRRSCKVVERTNVNASTAQRAQEQVSSAKQAVHRHRKHRKHRKGRKSSSKKPSAKTSGQASVSARFADAIPADLSAVAFRGQEGAGIATILSAIQQMAIHGVAILVRDLGPATSTDRADNNNSPIFAPSVGTMLRRYNGNYEAAAKAHCGMIALVKHPDGKVTEMAIGDGFDDRFVRKPGSIDIAHNLFNAFNGAATNDKDVVVQGVTWTLTGRRSQQYAFKGRGN